MNLNTIQVNEDVVADIQMKDATVQVLQKTLSIFLDTHTLDATDDILNSPVCVGFQKKLVDAKVAFEQAKDSMINENLDADTRQKVVNWDLNYSSGILSYITE